MLTWMTAPTVEAGVEAPPSTNGLNRVAWLAPANTLTLSNMVLSHTRGVLALARQVMTVVSRTNSWPNTIPAMYRLSSARSIEVTAPMNGFEEYFSRLSVMYRCRFGTGTSIGSQTTPPDMCSAGDRWLSLVKLRKSSRLPGRRTPSRPRT